MNPSLALLIWVVALLGLFYYDPAREHKSSAALWVPVTWLFFLGSRPPAMWLGVSYGGGAQALEEGNPLDRTIFTLLTFAAFAILASRSFPLGNFVRQNSALACFLTFALLSVVWSDFPLATFKKWFRDMGAFMVVLVVLSDRRPLEAVRTVLRRVCYLLVPLSVVLIKYYPYLGKLYSPWGGQEYTGVSTTKNMLGAVCLVSGIFFFWDTITRWHQRRDVRGRRVILVDIVFIWMILWLLNLSQSSTSTICLAIGCLMIAAAHCNFGRRHPGWIKALAPITFFTYLILTLGFGMGGQLSQAVGKSSDMSDRTHIWQVLLSTPINPVLGTGYQSFWLGPRARWVWARLSGDNVMEAHDGYLQIYLDLGLIGLFLLGAFLIATYLRICQRLDPLTPLGSLSLGFWTLLLFYNVTEASFEVDLLFLTFLLAAVPVSKRTGNPPTALCPVDVDLAERPASIETVDRGWSGARVGRMAEKGGAARGSSERRKAGSPLEVRGKGVRIKGRLIRNAHLNVEGHQFFDYAGSAKATAGA
jgi:exopolysaccharide production protein ExoQ